jgi:hypothetical protein
MTTRLFITLIIIIDLLFLSCYTKPKIDLSKIGNTYEISGTWIREGGFVSDYNGQSSAYKIVYTLLFSEDGTYRSSCDDSELLGRFEVKKDTVILINSIELISR